MEIIYSDVTASSGIAIGKALLFHKPNLCADARIIPPMSVNQEIDLYCKAVRAAASELEAVSLTSDIFKAHGAIVNDTVLHEEAIKRIKTLHQNAQLALQETIDRYCSMLGSMTDEYMRERIADLRDVQNRIMSNLKGISDTGLHNIKEEVILISRELLPSDIVAANADLVKGFITESGGVASHAVIIAKNKGIPALVGVKGVLEKVKSGDLIVLDSANSKIIINPDQDVLQEYRHLMQETAIHNRELAKISLLPAVTLDNRRIRLNANAGSLEDVLQAVKFNVDGIGLFRSEFLYMENNSFPTEEEQFEVYRKAAILCNGKITIRTLDIGGDKFLPYYPFDKEDNPFLGWRAIRISLELRDIFKTQLRAILRASAYGKLRIMYPFIVSLEELRLADDILAECRKELEAEGIAYNPDINVGIMIETPSAVLCIDTLVRNVDFISIGTNDLTQYMLAVDRNNGRISKMYDPYHPAVIKSIKQVIEAAHKRGIEVSLCGELAADDKATLLLLGLGLDEFSVPPGNIPRLKEKIRSLSYWEASEVAEKAAAADTIALVKECLS